MTFQREKNDLNMSLKKKLSSFSSEKQKSKFPTISKLTHTNTFMTYLRNDKYKEILAKSYFEKYKKETMQKKKKLPKLNNIQPFHDFGQKKLSKIFIQLNPKDTSDNNNPNHLNLFFRNRKTQNCLKIGFNSFVHSNNNNHNSVIIDGLSLSFSNILIRNSMNRSSSTVNFYKN